MLSELRIRSYALMDDLTIELGPGLTVLTGETGAGKSVIIGALSLILGEKPDADMIRSGADTAQVEGRFDLRPDAAAQLQQFGVATSAEDSYVTLILRRRVERTGRGAAYANDSGVTIAALERLGDRLVDLHGQHQHQLLLKPEVHLEILDEYAGLTPERAKFAELFFSFEQAGQELARLDRELAERRARRELTEFQLRELADAKVQPAESEELHRERELMQSTERRFTLVQQLEGLLSEQEGSVIELLSLAGRAFAELAELDPGLADRRDTLASVQAASDDLWRELVRYGESIEYSPERMEEINARLFLLQKLERKYGLPAAELPALESRLREELDSLETGTTRRDELAAALERSRAALCDLAGALSRRRARACTELEAGMKNEFAVLGMGKAELSVKLTRNPDPHGVYEQGGQCYRMTATGIDTAEFLFCANPGEELRPLRKVASGGELSRIMLGFKSVLTHADPVPTLVFDEVDVGIGGKVAEQVGRKLSALARFHQVICVTHLPQIAKYADHHLLVAKTSRSGRTLTAIRRLDEAERVAEIARMAGGTTVTETGLAHAREMLKSATGKRSG